MSTAPVIPLPVDAASGRYLGPGVLVAFEGTEVVVERADGGRANAALALAYPYRPRVGDVLLVIADRPDGPHFVIGVLQGSGQSVVEVPGDLELRAVGGELTLSGDRGVKVRGPSLDVTVERAEILAEKLVQTCGSIFQRVRELLTVQAKESHTSVEGHAVTQAGSATLLTEDKVVVNGKQIHVG